MGEIRSDEAKSKIKSAWDDFKKLFAWLFISTVLGFCMGKLYTWDTIATDCKVLGMFRIGNVPFDCRMSKI